MKLDIQMFADGKVVIDTELNSKNFENGLNRLQSTTQKAGSTIKSIVAGLGISKAISMAISTINNSIDSSIDRLDTLRNFPKVMSNLGIAGDKAQASITKMSDKLSGLPTTLNQGALAVQRFASANSDVEKSTDIFLALNNAILAGGASSEIQASALEQLSQAYAKGKPDMMEWRTAMTAMPAQLKQVATAMGYVSTDELGEALRKGEVSMDKFMDTIVRLNEEGIEGFENFETQARNSVGGIKTSITVAKTQVVKGVADIIDALDIKLEKLGFGKISEIIAGFGKDTKKGLDGIADLIKGDTSQMIMDLLIKFEEEGPKVIETFLKGINSKIPKLIETGGNLLSELMAGINANLQPLFNGGIEIATTIINGVADKIPMLVPKVVDTMMQLFMILSNPENIDKMTEAGANLLFALIDGIIESIPQLIENTEFTLEAIFNILSGGMNLMRKVGFSLIKALIKGFIKSIPKLIDSGKEVIDSLVAKFNEIVEKAKEIGGKIIKSISDAIGEKVGEISNAIGEVINSIVEWFQQLPEKIGELVNSAIEFIKQIPYYLGYAVGVIIGYIAEFGAKIGEFVTVTIPNFINGIIQWFAQLPEKIGNFFIQVGEKIAELGREFINFLTVTVPEFINGIVQWFAELPGKIWNWLVDVVNKIANWGNDMVNKGKQAVKNTSDTVVNGFKEIPGKVVSIGKDIVKGLWNGIKGAGNWIKDKIKGFADGLVDGFKSVFGIKSPSKVMRDQVGKWLPLGMYEGFEDELSGVYKDMEKAINFENAKLQANVETGKVFNTLTNTTPIYVHVDADVEMDNTKVGRIITPVVSETLKTGGLR